MVFTTTSRAVAAPLSGEARPFSSSGNTIAIATDDLDTAEQMDLEGSAAPSGQLQPAPASTRTSSRRRHPSEKQREADQQAAAATVAQRRKRSRGRLHLSGDDGIASSDEEAGGDSAGDDAIDDRRQLQNARASTAVPTGRPSATKRANYGSGGPAAGTATSAPFHKSASSESSSTSTTGSALPGADDRLQSADDDGFPSQYQWDLAMVVELRLHARAPQHIYHAWMCLLIMGSSLFVLSRLQSGHGSAPVTHPTVCTGPTDARTVHVTDRGILWQHVAQGTLADHAGCRWSTEDVSRRVGPSLTDHFVRLQLHARRRP